LEKRKFLQRTEGEVKKQGEPDACSGLKTTFRQTRGGGGKAKISIALGEGVEDSERICRLKMLGQLDEKGKGGGLSAGPYTQGLMKRGGT